SSLITSLGIDRMSPDERLQLVQEIWDSLAEEAEASPLTEAQRQEVDRRWAAHLANPQAAIPWEQVEAESLDRPLRWSSQYGSCPRQGSSLPMQWTGMSDNERGWDQDSSPRFRPCSTASRRTPSTTTGVRAGAQGGGASIPLCGALQRGAGGSRRDLGLSHVARSVNLASASLTKCCTESLVWIALDPGSLRPADGLEGGEALEGRQIARILPGGHALDHAAQDLAAARLGQLGHEVHPGRNE